MVRGIPSWIKGKPARLQSASRCCGCGACRVACPKGAIAMREDAEGFHQPVVDAAKCVRCGKCEEVCPVSHPGKPRKPLSAYAAKAKDVELRKGSASGGVFTVLAQEILNRGGVVFGAGFERTTWRVIHQAVTNEAMLDDLRGSKYVQSDTADTFKEAKSYLDEGREVLYSGCPCQIAALKRFLGRDYPKLLTVDLICHGVPSPFAWRKYLDCREKEADGKIVAIAARRHCSWRSYEISLQFNHGATTYTKGLYDDPYMKSFLSFGYLRKSCYHCAFRKISSGASISLGDYFLIDKRCRGFGDDYGVSSVIVADAVGEEAFKRCEIKLKTYEVGYDAVKVDVDSIRKNPSSSKARSYFYKLLPVVSFDEAVAQAFARRQPSLLMHLLWWCKRLVVNHEFNAIKWR